MPTLPTPEPAESFVTKALRYALFTIIGMLVLFVLMFAVEREEAEWKDKEQKNQVLVLKCRDIERGRPVTKWNGRFWSLDSCMLQSHQEFFQEVK